jgi:glycosyltransferase involved in cell wall biosynthesis
MPDETTAERIALSVVIPAYNEAPRLPGSLARLRAYLDAQPYQAEVIVVDDGSTDGTAEIVETLGSAWPALRLVQGAHSGKGGAVRAGVLAARGDDVALADADLAMPVEQFDRFTPALLGDHEVAIGSREAPGAVRYDEPAYRHLMGRVFNSLVRWLLLPGLQDTQCGFKRLRREVAVELCQAQTITGFAFDVELLSIARRRGYAIREVPVSWYFVPGSRVSPVRDTVAMVRDVLRIRANLRRGHYTLPASEVAAPIPTPAPSESLPLSTTQR